MHHAATDSRRPVAWLLKTHSWSWALVVETSHSRVRNSFAAKVRWVCFGRDLIPSVVLRSRLQPNDIAESGVPKQLLLTGTKRRAIQDRIQPFEQAGVLLPMRRPELQCLPIVQ